MIFLPKQKFSQFRFNHVAILLLLVGYFFIPIAPAPVHIAIFSSLAFSFFSRKIRSRYRSLLGFPVFRWFFIFYLILIFSSLYGSGTIEQKLHYLGKYLEIGYMPFMAAICFEEHYREKSLQLFSIAMLGILSISILLFFGFNFHIISNRLVFTGNEINPTVFKLHITQNFLMAFAVFLWAQCAVNSSRPTLKIFYFLISALGLINIIFMVEGRTGYVTLVALGAALVFDRVSIKKVCIGVLVFVIVMPSVYMLSPKVQSRVNMAIADVSDWRPNVRTETPVGARLEFWFFSYQIIKKAPLLGFGIAGFESEYKEIAAASNVTSTVNPHNQYLLFLCQIGVLGTLVFMILNFVIWRESLKLEARWRIWVRAILLGYAGANIFNSMLLDFAEGIFFSASLAIAFSICLTEKKYSTKGMQ